MSRRTFTASPLDRRELLGLSAAFGASFLAAQGLAGERPAAPAAGPRFTAAPKQYAMKKSINLWAFPYPSLWTLKDCFQIAKDAGFDGVEVNFNLEGEFSAKSTPDELAAVGELARDCGIAISGICSFLYWPYPLTSNDPEKRKTSVELGKKMIAAAKAVGTENVLVVPGAVYAPWIENFDPTPNDVCLARARAGVRELIPAAEEAGVHLNMENIFANAFLFSPQEMVDFVDGFESRHVHIHFDTGNIMQYQFPEHWIPILGKRTKNVHLKEWDKRTHEFNLHTFRTLLDGTTNWPAVMAAFDGVGYDGYLTFEYFHPHQHFPEALIYQTSDSLDYLLGRKGKGA